MEQENRDLSPMQYSAAWYQQRIGKFTASEIYRLMTEPKNKSDVLSQGALTYVLEKVGEELTGLSKDFNNDAMIWGSEQEGRAKRFYTKLTGNIIREVGFKEYGDFSGGSADGIIDPTESIPVIGCAEIKCPFVTTHHLQHCLIDSADYFKQYHKDYYWQLQANMLFWGAEYGHFISFDPRIKGDSGFFLFHLKANSDDHELIKTKLQIAINEKNRILEQFKAMTITIAQ